jgi:hypothetical protein
MRAVAMRAPCVLALLTAACAAPRAPDAALPGETTATGSDAGGSPVSGEAGASAPAADAGAEAAVSGPSLPELIVESIGLHVGGGSNDKDEKLPFERAVARQFPALRRCYLQVEQPGASGTFGVDLFIAAAGGHPEVRDARTAMRGTAFRDCVRAAFGAVEFEPLKKPTVISYSVRFRFAE